MVIDLLNPRASVDGIATAVNWKHRRHDRDRAAMERIHSHVVTVNSCFIVGLDGHTPDAFDETLRFVRKSGLYEVRFAFPTAFQGTSLCRRLKAEGRIFRDRPQSGSATGRYP